MQLGEHLTERCCGLLDVGKLGLQEAVTLGFALVLLDGIIADVAHPPEAIAQPLDIPLSDVVLGGEICEIRILSIRNEIIWILIVKIVTDSLMQG
jgi:hypothetical protein